MATPVPRSPPPTSTSKPTSMPVNGSVDPADVATFELASFEFEVATLHVSEAYVWHSEVVPASAELGASINTSPTSIVAKRFMSPFRMTRFAAPQTSLSKQVYRRVQTIVIHATPSFERNQATGGRGLEARTALLDGEEELERLRWGQWPLAGDAAQRLGHGGLARVDRGGDTEIPLGAARIAQFRRSQASAQP